jgi:hypothetical protein
MSITAKQLSKSGAKGKELEAVVREQLLIIDERLQRTERTWGRNVIAHDLPTSLAFPGLEKRDAQRIIYTAIVRSLLDRGFGARLRLEAECTVLYIEWVTDLNTEEVESMNRLIRQVRISAEEVDEFLRRAPSRPGAPPETAVSEGWAVGGGDPPPDY